MYLGVTCTNSAPCFYPAPLPLSLFPERRINLWRYSRTLTWSKISFFPRSFALIKLPYMRPRIIPCGCLSYGWRSVVNDRLAILISRQEPNLSAPACLSISLANGVVQARHNRLLVQHALMAVDYAGGSRLQSVPSRPALLRQTVHEFAMAEALTTGSKTSLSLVGLPLGHEGQPCAK